MSGALKYKENICIYLNTTFTNPMFKYAINTLTLKKNHEVSTIITLILKVRKKNEN